MKNLVRLPGNILINANEIDNITPVESKGVLIKNRFGQILAFIREENQEKIDHYAEELMNLAMAIQDKRRYTLNFELPVPSLPAPSNETDLQAKKAAK